MTKIIRPRFDDLLFVFSLSSVAIFLFLGQNNWLVIALGFEFNRNSRRRDFEIQEIEKRLKKLETSP